jgi:hypothetical protein
MFFLLIKSTRKKQEAQRCQKELSFNLFLLLIKRIRKKQEAQIKGVKKVDVF